MKFPYQAYRVLPSLDDPEGILRRPEIPVRIAGPDGSELLMALLDSGADNTILPRWTQEFIGAHIDRSQSTTVSGIGGQELAVFPGEVTLILEQDGESSQWTTRVHFADDDVSESAAILGQTGCLRHFRATFDGDRAEVELLPTPDFAALTRSVVTR